MSSKDEMKQKELYIISQLRKGYSPKYVIAKVVENFGIAEATATNQVYKINSQLNKTNTQLLEEAKDYIVNQLLTIIDDCIDKEDVKNRLVALKQLSDVTKLTEQKISVDNFEIKFG